MHIRDRIKQLRRVPAGQLLRHPLNWRTHPDAQRDALRAVLADVGYADALLARELPDGALQLIDGHLRAETTPEAIVPVLVLDVDEQEAEQILLTHDPIAALATHDQRQLAALMERCDASPQVTAMLQELLDQADAEMHRLEQALQDDVVALPESHQVVVECNDEADQQAVYLQMRKEGYRCRVLTL